MIIFVKLRKKEWSIISTIYFTDPDYYDVYNPPYGQPGYTDYDYGDYNEGVGLYPPKKLTISQRVAKWFSGFKIPSSKVIFFRYTCFETIHQIFSIHWF